MEQAIGSLVEKKSLPPETMQACLNEMFSGAATPVQMSAFLVALRMKGETASEIAAAAQVMRNHATHVQVRGNQPLLDTCGTGGDGQGTFNVSTATAIALAATGVRVAKHGNRSVSSQCGSADVLEALGIRLEQTPAAIAHSIEELGIGFLFAPLHHPALKHVGPVRKELRMRTLFNLLGPLANPANVTHQLLGVYEPARVEPIAEVLLRLGLEGAWVVCGEGGIDELSIAGPTQVAVCKRGSVSLQTIKPEHFGLKRTPLTQIQGGDAARNAEIIRDVLAGKPGPYQDVVVLNAAAALCVIDESYTFPDAAGKVRDALVRGAGAKKLSEWIHRSHAPQESSA